ncbi:MAG: hypothetical protein ACTH0J_13325, partial [Corynebacterium variabile]|uniref:hypothetical protein n=1 Tax=Corynebacterium variabile TaxID=1727 RepID=UPI003F93F19E
TANAAPGHQRRAVAAVVADNTPTELPVEDFLMLLEDSGALEQLRGGGLRRSGTLGSVRRLAGEADRRLLP